MANTQKPSGFRPVQERDGSPWTGKTSAVAVSTGSAANIGIGDLVKFTGDQLLVDGTYYQEVTKAVASDTRLAGAMVRRQYDADGYKSYVEATPAKPVIIHIPQSSDVIYSAQESGDMGTGAAEANADFIVGATDVTTGLSTSSIDSSTVANTSTLPLRVVSYDLSPSNEAGEFATWLVTINQDAYSDKAGI